MGVAHVIIVGRGCRSGFVFAEVGFGEFGEVGGEGVERGGGVAAQGEFFGMRSFLSGGVRGAGGGDEFAEVIGDVAGKAEGDAVALCWEGGAGDAAKVGVIFAGLGDPFLPLLGLGAARSNCRELVIECLERGGLEGDALLDGGGREAAGGKFFGDFRSPEGGIEGLERVGDVGANGLVLNRPGALW